MLSYNLRLALASYRRNPTLTALVAGAIALGIAVCTITLTLYHGMSNNPIWWKSDKLYSVTIDSWDPKRPDDEKHPERPPPQLTYKDATALLKSDIPGYKVAMFRADRVLDAGVKDVKPKRMRVRVTTGDFFRAFDVPFQYGGPWTNAADQGPEPLVVLDRETNEKVFGGANSVGRTVRLNDREFRIAGVLDTWEPTPSYYDLNNGSFLKPESIYIPYLWGEQLELSSNGNTNCWKTESLNSYQDFKNSECVWIQFWAEFASGADRQRFQSWLDGYVKEQKKLGRMPRPLNNRLYTVDQWLEFNAVVSKDNRVLVGLAFMFLAVCIINTVGLLLAKFLSGASLSGLRRALGASRRDIFHQHLIEVVVLGLAGGLLGLALSAVGLLGLRRLFASEFSTYDALAHMDTTMVAAAIALSLVAGLLAGLYPAWRIGRIQPATYLKTQ
ncbi:MAG: ABC transporter permease [Steroidobacterales bacterium]